MKYTIEMGLGGMINTQNFIKIGSAIQKLMGRGMHRHIQTGW
jgi:hypothetical protein